MAEQSRVGTIKAMIDGLVIVAHRPSLVVWVWILVFLFALVGSFGVQGELVEAIGQSRLADDMKGSIDVGLIEEIAAGSDGLLSSIQAVRLSSAATFDNVDIWLSGDWVSEHRGLVAVGILFVVAWVFYQGGVVEHLINRRPKLRISEFFEASGEYFWRLLRLSLVTGIAYYGVYRIGSRLFPWIEDSTVDVTSERLAMSLYAAGALILIAMLSLVHLTSDYAKISLVMHHRRSSLLAAISALFQILAHPVQTFGLLGLSASLLLILQLLYFWVSPSPEWRSVAALVAIFVIGQMYVLGRWAIRLSRLSAQIQLVESWARPVESRRR